MKFHKLAELFPLISGEEYEDLKNDICENGLKQPIIVKDGEIVDGRNRYNACVEMGVEPRFIEWQGDDLARDILSWNIQRRHLSSSQRAAIAVEFLPFLEEQAQIRKKELCSEGGKKGNEIRWRSCDGVSQKVAEPDGKVKNRSDEKAAKLMHSNRRYVSSAKKIKEEAPEIFNEIKNGEITIAKAREKINQQQAHKFSEERAESPPLPEGKFRTIVIDPPWMMKKIIREVRPNQSVFDYPVMSLEEIAEIPIPEIAADECHLYLWTTQKYLPHSFDLLKQWGFTYIFTQVWHKNGGFQPVHLPQYNCEFVVFGRKGGLKFLDTKQFFTCFQADRREHSRKPDCFYELVSRVSPEPRIDFFSREKRNGFLQYGTETEKFQK